MARLCVAGTLLVDEVLTLAHPVLPGSQQRALSRRVDGGGQVWHTALAAARTGTAVTVAGRCGADADARALCGRLAAAGVDVALRAAGVSRRAVVLDMAGQERAIVSVAGDGARLPPDDLGAASLHESTWLHLDGYGLDDDAGDLLLDLAAAAVAAGVPVSLEPPSLSGLPWRRDRCAALPPLHLVVGRPDEVDAVLRLLGGRPDVVVHHDGPRPATWQGRTRAIRVDVPPGRFEATLGAGDRFTGGLLAALLAGAGPAAALRAGIAAAPG